MEEFRVLVVDHILTNQKDFSPREVIESFLEVGLGKFEPARLAEFLASLRGWLFLPTVAVDIGDSQFLWVVSGSCAILVNKPKDSEPASPHH